jgi:hypothetical protein
MTGQGPTRARFALAAVTRLRLLKVLHGLSTAPPSHRPSKKGKRPLHAKPAQRVEELIAEARRKAATGPATARQG